VPLTVEPSKAGVSQGKSECWVFRGTGVGQMGGRMGKGVSLNFNNGSCGEVELSPTTPAKSWTFQVNLNDHNFPNNYVLTAIVLFDDGGKESNQLRAWIDYANGRLLEPDAHAKILVGKWADDANDFDGLHKNILTFNKDGTYLVQGKLKTEKKGESIDEKGTWKVADGFLETKPENPAPDLAGIRRTLIFEINDMSFKTWDRESLKEVREWKRVKAE
jgi:hypothetical protein